MTGSVQVFLPDCGGAGKFRWPSDHVPQCYSTTESKFLRCCYEQACWVASHEIASTASTCCLTTNDCLPVHDMILLVVHLEDAPSTYIECFPAQQYAMVY